MLFRKDGICYGTENDENVVINLAFVFGIRYKLVDGAQTKHRTAAKCISGAGRRDALGWFRRICPHAFFCSLQADLGIRERIRIFTFPVTVWLMIVQRLSGGTLADAVAELVAGNGWELLEPCSRVRRGAVSLNTGAYSQARMRVPVEGARQIAQHTFEYLHTAAPRHSVRERAFLMDGTSIRLPHTAALLKQYPAASNQHGDAHWPIMRVVTIHHVVTGLALPPCYGPMYGDNGVGEQELAEQMLERLPAGSVLVGDRNFGVFSLVWQACSKGHDVLVRLKQDRAALLTEALAVNADQSVEWQPSARELRAHPELTRDIRLKGRLVVVQGELSSEPLYLFTTLRESTGDIASLYKERWNVETDLRSLKEQMKLHSISAKTPDMAASELMLAIAAYNLIRAVMQEAARQAGIQPRRLSYSRAQSCFWPFIRLLSTTSGNTPDFEYHWQRFIRAIAQCKLPNRSRPSAPRAIWPKRSAFPTRQTSQEKTK